MAMDAKEVARIIKEELEGRGEILAIDFVDALDTEDAKIVLGAETLDGHGVFVTVENY